MLQRSFSKLSLELSKQIFCNKKHSREVCLEDAHAYAATYLMLISIFIIIKYLN